ncbi:peptidoglycan-binding protein [Streptomyces sp. NPDC059837]|uniref:peptidoglycan-binding protein n=1 Tax=Streptomyces sp. NPDC059837 TaxID=3346968 RepID=UPI0036695FF3
MGWNMPRWMELPDSLDERMRTLVVQLRGLKDHSGLSLSSLQTKTGYSRASWERYLNGKVLPPRQAVGELARVVGVDPARVLALHEVAEEAWRQEPDASKTADPPKLRRTRRSALIGVLVAVVFGGLSAGLLVVAPWEHGGSTSPSRGAFAYQAGKTYHCVVKRKDGPLYASYSTTSTALLSGPAWDVVEAQCLLQYHGFDPGVVDGAYGPNTTRAVKRLQSQARLPVDGVVGPHTWQVLRK